jgi:hypothetical protein
VTKLPRFIPLLPLALVLCACTSSSGFSQPTASAFTPGGCRDLAPAVLTLGKQIAALGSKPPSKQARSALATAQKSVREQQSALDPALAPTVQSLVTAVGVLRIRADTNSYASGLRDDALKAYDAVVSACTAPGPSPS